MRKANYLYVTAILLGGSCVAKAATYEGKKSSAPVFTAVQAMANSGETCWYNPNCYSDGWCRAFWECDGGPGDGEYEDEASCNAACK